MSFLNFNKQCPGNMTLRSPAGIIIAYYQCQLLKEHEGPHKGKDGTMWANSERITSNDSDPF